MKRTEWILCPVCGNKTRNKGSAHRIKKRCWLYAGIYEICGTDKTEAVAVKINNRYYVATSDMKDNLKSSLEKQWKVEQQQREQIEAQINTLCLTKGICLHMEKGINLGNAKADKLLLERAIMNVIANALDYSPPKGTIYADVQKSNGFLQISITDEGRGFTPEALHHAHEQFFTGDKSRTSNMHFGMGLYITSSIIKQHNGQLIFMIVLQTHLTISR